METVHTEGRTRRSRPVPQFTWDGTMVLPTLATRKVTRFKLGLVGLEATKIEPKDNTSLQEIMGKGKVTKKNNVVTRQNQ